MQLNKSAVLIPNSPNDKTNTSFARLYRQFWVTFFRAYIYGRLIIARTFSVGKLLFLVFSSAGTLNLESGDQGIRIFPNSSSLYFAFASLCR